MEKGKPTLIYNGTIVNEGSSFIGSLLIINGYIEKIFKDEVVETERFDRANLIDAKGLHILPGVIDDQVHFREPGNTHKGTISSESAAAVLGGVTSYMDMPNNNPPTVTNEALNRKKLIAQEESYANYSFYLGASNENIEEIKAVDRKSVCGVKVFMGSSTGNMLVDNIESLNRIFSESPILIATHCEEESIIRKNLANAIERYGEENIPFREHCNIRDRNSCIESTKKAIDLAIRHKSRLHVLHISTEEEIEMIKQASEINPLITGEVCVHYMLLDNSMYDSLGSKMKCNPSVKAISDREAIINAVKKGIIKVVATDHAPHTKSEKESGYLRAPSGLPLIQHSLQMMLEMYKEGIFTIEDIVSSMSHSPANNFMIEKRGYLREGYFADIVLVDINKSDKESTVKPAYLCGWSPFEGKIFASSVIHTFVNGVQIVSEGKLTGLRAGMNLEFGV
ncbi:MAG: dihydroorotase [Bacteroidales bacterium]